MSKFYTKIEEVEEIITACNSTLGEMKMFEDLVNKFSLIKIWRLILWSFTEEVLSNYNKVVLSISPTFLMVKYTISLQTLVIT